MKAENFPLLSSGLGLLLWLLVVYGSKLDASSNTLLPMLSLLIMNEFAFFLTAVGAFLGFRQIYRGERRPAYLLVCIMCLILTVIFIWQGLQLWDMLQIDN